MQGRIVPFQMLADRFPEPGDGMLIDPALPSRALQRQAAFCGVELRDVLTMLGQAFGKHRILGGHQPLLDHFEQAAHPRFDCHLLPPDTTEILEALCVRGIGPLQHREQQFAAAERILAGPMLLPIGILWVYGTRTFLGGGWEESHALVGDWTAHANYVPAFLFGLALRSSEPLRSIISRWWPVAAAAAVGGWLILAGVELAWPGGTVAPHWVWLPYDAARAVECWCAIVALIGIADRYWNADHRWRPLLAEAVFPFYIIYQTIIVVVGYWLLGTTMGALSRFGILIAATAGGCWIFYLVGRKVRLLRPLIGLTLSGRRG